MEAPITHRLRRLADGLEATPAEIVGLLVLLVGGIVLAGALWWLGIPRPAPVPVDASAVAPTAGPVVVYVSGAVVSPGVVTLAGGSRVADAVDAAGGATLDADLSGLNLARPVTDGEQIVVPAFGVAERSGNTEVTKDDDGRIDLNTADAVRLQELPGVGPVIAGRIISWREQHGPFTSVGELREVPGIGERTFQALADLVAVS